LPEEQEEVGHCRLGGGGLDSIQTALGPDRTGQLHPACPCNAMQPEMPSVAVASWHLA